MIVDDVESRAGRYKYRPERAVLSHPLPIPIPSYHSKLLYQSIMRFSTLAVSLLSGLSAFKGVSASPIEPAALAKRQTIDEVVNDLKSAVVSLTTYIPSPIVLCLVNRPFADIQADPVLILKNPDVSAADAQSALQTISSAISAANAAVPGSVLSARRSLAADTNVERSELSTRQADDLEIVGRVLAEIITDLVDAISGLADNLKGLPLIVS
jgi:hypothetical protein